MVLGMVSVLCHVVSLTILLQGEGGGDPAPALMSHLARSILKVGRGVGVGTLYSRLHGDPPTERGAFFVLPVYERVGDLMF